MRFKCRAEDFRVEELLRIEPGRSGPFAIYALRKRGVTTLAVEESLAVRLGVPRAGLGFPALKDKQAEALQHFSVRRGGGAMPPRIRGPGFEARLAGFTGRPLQAADLAGNRFTVVARDLGADEPPVLAARLQRLSAEGLPNYFDAQRFGSWSPTLGFPGRLLVEKDWEGALRAWLVEPQLGDEPDVAAFKADAREHWGDFGRVAGAAARSHRRSILVFLRDHPTAFKKAVNLVQPRLLALFLQAWQSWLWNRIAGRFIHDAAESAGVASEPLQLPMGNLPWPMAAPRPLLERVRGESLPMPHAKAVIEAEGLRRAAATVLASEGVDWSDLKARSVERAWLARGRRALWIIPGEPRWRDEKPDELHPGRRRLTLGFSLPPGSYATLVLRALGSR